MRTKYIGFHAPKQVFFRHRPFNFRFKDPYTIRYPKHMRQFFRQGVSHIPPTSFFTTKTKIDPPAVPPGPLAQQTQNFPAPFQPPPNLGNVPSTRSTFWPDWRALPYHLLGGAAILGSTWFLAHMRDALHRPPLPYEYHNIGIPGLTPPRPPPVHRIIRHRRNSMYGLLEQAHNLINFDPNAPRYNFRRR